MPWGKEFFLAVEEGAECCISVEAQETERVLLGILNDPH